MNRFLLIGGGGFIGSAITKQLLLNGSEVFVFELPEANISRLESIKEKVKIYYGNLSQHNVIKNIIKENRITTVLHLASSLIPSSTESQYYNDLENIVYPTIKLLPMFSDLGIKFVFFSSGGAVYGKKSLGKFSETDQLMPISHYGQSKLILEESIKFENRKSGLNYLIMRPSNPYGAGQSLYGKQGLIATCIYNIKHNQKIQIWGDGKVIRDYIYIDDFVQIVISLINKSEGKQIYNIGSGIGSSVNDVLDFLKHNVDKKIEIEYLESRDIDASNIVLIISKLSMIVDFDYTSLNNGIKKFLLNEILL
jgi:UDP-glucose 4-epimerase